MSGRPRLRGVGRVRAVYLVRHENRVLGVGFIAAVEIQIHPRIGETVKALNGFLQAAVSEADSPAAPVPTTTTS